MTQLARRGGAPGDASPGPRSSVDVVEPATTTVAEPQSSPFTAEELAVLGRAIGFSVATFRPSHLETRITRAIARHDVEDVASLAALVRADPEARLALRRSIAISVTGFFRDADQFAVLEPHLDTVSSIGRPRVWSAGCSTGEELWTVAVLLARRGLAERSQLLGSDLLEENVREARRLRTADELGGEALPAGTRLRFETRDIAADGPPGSRWDLVVCRNMAIYLEAGARALVHAMLCGSLSPGGLLLLGRSERLSDPHHAGMELIGPHLYRKLAP